MSPARPSSSVEMTEVQDFLANHEPFAHLPDPELERLTAAVTMRYHRRGEKLIKAGTPNHELFFLRSGAVDVLSAHGTLVDRRGAGLSCGYSTLVEGAESEVSNYTMEVIEDALVIVISRDTFTELCRRHADIARFYSGQTRRTSAAVRELEQDSTELLRTPVGGIELRTPTILAPEAPVVEAARAMTSATHSSALVLGDGPHPLGIVTDRDLRERVLAAGLDPATPVSEVMTPNPITVDAEAMAMEVFLTMAQHGFHHVPVMRGGEVAGVVSHSDIAKLLHADPIMIAANFATCRSAAEMRGAFSQAATLAARLVERGSSPQEVASIISAVADAAARRLCELAEQRLGPPPVGYCFVALGSQGRREMGLASDQDNALVLDDSYRLDEHGEYFAQFGEFVCAGLAAAGQALCPGEMMASNPQWRLTVSEWDRQFARWLTAPQPDALLHTQVFFDMRPIAGATELGQRVHRTAVRTAASATRAHAHLASLAARREPPLTFFRGLVVRRDGEHDHTLDIKRGGTAAIVQMARVYALAAGAPELESGERLRAAAGQTLSKKGAGELADALTYLRLLALRHQVRAIHAGAEPDYDLDPRELGRMDRERLRDAFRTIKAYQNALATKYPVRTI